jgi:hypothetical protein
MAEQGMDQQLLREVVGEAWGRFSTFVDSELTRHITEPKWDWPSGESPRDIVDIGDLRNSQEMAINHRPGVMETKFRWTAPHAPAVHDGAVYKANDSEGQPRTRPARPWTRELQRERVKLQRAFQLHFTLSAKRRGLGGTRRGGAAPAGPSALPPAGGAA